MSMSVARRIVLPFAGILGLALMLPPALADTEMGGVQVKELSDSATTDEMIDALTPEAPGPDIATRGLRPVEEATKPKAVALQIPFEFDSYKLTGEAKGVLDKLGAALQSPQLRDHAFTIEGHTDSVGTAAYNQRLSELRAWAVKQHLVEAYQIDPNRLHTEGKGESAPLDPSDATGARNRRVQVVLENP